MKLEPLTLLSLRACPLLLPLRRPIVARIATIAVTPIHPAFRVIEGKWHRSRRTL
jgi:hypothetical protein